MAAHFRASSSFASCEDDLEKTPFKLFGHIESLASISISENRRNSLASEEEVCRLSLVYLFLIC